MRGAPSPQHFFSYTTTYYNGKPKSVAGGQLYVFVDDIAVCAPTKETLLHTLDTLHDLAYTMGLRFNKDKTEVCH